MDFSLAVLAFILLAVNFAYKAFLKPRIIDEDTFQLLRSAREIRRSGKLPEVLDCNLFDGRAGKKFDYPPLFPWMLSWFDPDWLLKYFHLVTPFTDTVTATVTFYLVYSYVGDGYAALLVLLIHLAAPIIYLESFHLTGRILSMALYVLFLVPLIMYVEAPNPFLLLPSVISGTLLLLEHCLAIQALIPVLLGLTIYDGSPVYAAALLLSIGLAAALSRGHSFYVHRGHLNKLAFDRDTVHLRATDQLQPIRKKPPRLRQMSHAAPGKIQTIGKLALMEPLPFIWLIVLGVWLKGAEAFQNASDVRLLLWLSILFAVYIATEFVRPLRFLGHGRRYLHYAVIPTGVLVWRILFSDESPWLSMYSVLFSVSVIGCLVLNAYYAFRYYAARSKSYSESDLSGAARVLGSLPGDNVVVLPYTLAAYVGFVSDKRILMKFGSDGCHASADFFPQVKRPMKQFVSDYCIRYFFVDSDYVSFDELNVDPARLVFKIGKFELYQVAPDPGILMEGAGAKPEAVMGVGAS